MNVPAAVKVGDDCPSARLAGAATDKLRRWFVYSSLLLTVLSSVTFRTSFPSQFLYLMQ